MFLVYSLFYSHFEYKISTVIIHIMVSVRVYIKFVICNLTHFLCSLTFSYFSRLLQICIIHLDRKLSKLRQKNDKLLIIFMIRFVSASSICVVNAEHGHLKMLCKLHLHFCCAIFYGVWAGHLDLLKCHRATDNCTPSSNQPSIL